MSTAIAIGSSTLTLPIPGENYDLAITNGNNTAIATEVNRLHNIKHAEYIGPSVSSSAGAGVNFGQMTVDAAINFNNTFVIPAGTTGLKILETGLYILTERALPAASGGNVHLWCTRTGSVSDDIISKNFISYGSNNPIASATFYAVANDVIQCGITTSNTVNTGSRIKITKVQG